MTAGLSGRLGVHSLEQYALTVPDLDEARHFYDAFGLVVEEEGGYALALRTDQAPHIWARLIKGPAKRLTYLRFGAYASDMTGLRDRLANEGIDEIERPAEAGSTDGFWFRDLNGVPIEVGVASKTTLDAKEPPHRIESRTAHRNAPLRGGVPQVRPLRLSHLLMFVPDVFAAVDFYGRVLGLRLSDSAGDGIAFMHAIHGCDHHLIAFAKSSGVGFHHSSWDVPAIEYVGLGAEQMRAAGFDKGWGMGRHVLGSNYFHYVRDPWGSYAEYSHDMDYIPAGIEWEASSPPPENATHLWAPDQPADFVFNYEADNGAMA